jgi:putative addiction module component (TIGR02574 family)
MNVATEELLNAALALSEEDRLELIDALAASLQPDDRPPFEESWREVIQRRSFELRNGKVTAVPWSEVKRQAQERNGG